MFHDNLNISLNGSNKKENDKVTKTLNIEKDIWEEFNHLCEVNDGINRTDCLNQLLKAGFMYLEEKEKTNNKKEEMVFEENIYENKIRYPMAYFYGLEYEGSYELSYLDLQFIECLEKALESTETTKKELFNKIGFSVNKIEKECFLKKRNIKDVTIELKPNEVFKLLSTLFRKKEEQESKTNVVSVLDKVVDFDIDFPMIDCLDDIDTEDREKS